MEFFILFFLQCLIWYIDKFQSAIQIINYIREIFVVSFLKKYILLIMPLQLSHSLPFIPLFPAHPLPPIFLSFSSCPWVVHTSSLASPFPILFLTSPCLFSTCHLCYSFSVPFPPLSPSHSPTDSPPCDLHFDYTYENAHFTQYLPQMLVLFSFIWVNSVSFKLVYPIF